MCSCVRCRIKEKGFLYSFEISVRLLPPESPLIQNGLPVKFAKSLILLVVIVFMNALEVVVPILAKEKSAVQSGSPAGAAKPDSLKRRRDDIDSTVVYTARDSLLYNLSRRTADLFGKARVDYKGSRLEGPKIKVQQATTTIQATAAHDSLGRPSELPVFTDKAGSFRAESMEYNYQTRIGTATAMSSRDDQQGIFSGERVKRLSSGELLVDHGIYTTCDLEEPHYWFEGQSMKITPGERLASRPFIMYIHPEIFHRRLPVMPIFWLPYLSVPISSKRSSGFLFPMVGNSQSSGTWISNLGYFWAINDYADLRLAADVSFNGSWRFGERFRYINRDRYSGSFEWQYDRIELNQPDDPDHARYVNRNVRLIHHQMFDPTAVFDVNLQYIGGNRYDNKNSIDPESVITRQATSYASFSKAWDEGKRVLIAGYQRVDNLETGELTQSTTLSLYQNLLYPFRSASGVAETNWLSRVSIQPSLSASRQLVDAGSGRSDLSIGNAGLEIDYLHDFAPGYRAQFTQGMTLQAQRQTTNLTDDLGATRVQLPFTVHSTLFRHLNLTPAITFTRYRVNSTVRKYFDHGVKSVTVDQPDDYMTTVFSIGAETRLYGVLNTGWLENVVGLAAVRHTFIPAISFTCNPDYRGSDYDYYDSYLDTDLLSKVRYNRFENSLYSSVPEKRRSFGVTLQNLFHGRFRSDDITNGGGYRTVQLLSLTASSGYNAAADSLRAQPLVLTASSNAFSPALMFSAGSTYDFYSFDPVTGERIDRLAMDDGKGWLRFVNGFLNMSVSFSGTLRPTYQPVGRQDETVSLIRQSGSPVEPAIFRERFNSDELVKFSETLPWSLRLSLYLVSDQSDPRDPSTTTLLNSSAKLSLSKNWLLGVNSGLDLDTGRFVYPALMVYRDLHDFQFSCQWVPSGLYRGYLVQIAMKPAQLRSLKVQAASGNAGQAVQ
ncbi:MAG: LPS-assembly protein LptD [Chlorobiaceae bacterium]|nr:LPS-assembly protein LptD [Chlorobiaceae bacterium]